MNPAPNDSQGPGAAQSEDIPPGLADEVSEQLTADRRVRRSLPPRGRLHIDRQLPFLCVYRQPPEREDAGTERLVQGEASYLMASGASSSHESVCALVRAIAQALSPQFGAFLIVEIWAAADGGKANDPAVPEVRPTFTLHAPTPAATTHTIEALQLRLERIKILKQTVDVEVVQGAHGHPPSQKPLMTPQEAAELNCSFVGIAVPPVFRKPNSTEEFPLLAQSLRRSLSLALRHAYFEFARTRTTHRPAHYHTLGRHAVVKAVWKIDNALATVSNQFDYLLHLTPVNATRAWAQFKGSGFERVPEFHYRPLAVDPSRLKRALYNIPMERVEDPALQRVFREKQEELELKLTMLRDRETRRFLPASVQLFGGVSDSLLKVAEQLLRESPVGRPRGDSDTVLAEQFAEMANAEVDFYRKASPEFAARVRVTGDVSGLMVSRGTLLINSDLSLASSRVGALIAHEVGTHLVTYCNGKSQPFKQLASGLAGYEELQEGLAVLAEHLVGGLTSGRLRQIAARVVAVHHLLDRSSFVETFRALVRDHQFTERTAYNITMRVYRGGGLTKDAVYLRGLQSTLKYVSKGGDLNRLMVGKIAMDHVPLLAELEYREVLRPAPILPRHFQDAAALERLSRLRDGEGSVLELVRPSA